MFMESLVLVLGKMPEISLNILFELTFCSDHPIMETKNTVASNLVPLTSA